MSYQACMGSLQNYYISLGSGFQRRLEPLRSCLYTLKNIWKASESGLEKEWFSGHTQFRDCLLTDWAAAVILSSDNRHMFMITLSKLRAQAITAAKNGNWPSAVETNEQILRETPTDINALNRLGLAYLQLGDSKQATDCFKQTLQLDKTNNIAKKQLERISCKQMAVAPSFTREHFIEEPGRTKIVELHRLAGKPVLDQLSSGQSCNLVLKKRYISIETNQGVYIGALPEDLSFRLSKLVSTGNTYLCQVHSISNSQCSVYLKELTRSKKNQDIHSFPLNKTNINHVADLDDRFLLGDDEIPVLALDSDDEEAGKDFIEVATSDLSDQDN